MEQMFRGYVSKVCRMICVMFQTFARNTSCHGIKHIVQSDSIFRR